MPAAGEVKKIDPSWEKKDAQVSLGDMERNLMRIDQKILSCNESVTDAGLGGISYCVSQKREIQNRINAMETLVLYVGNIRSALQQQLDDPLFDGFNKKATETLSRIHPEKFQTANTLGLTVTVSASGHGETYSSKQLKDHLDLYDFLGYTVGNYSGYGCLRTANTDCVQDFADMFKADYDSMSKAGMLKGSNVKSLDDYLKNLVNGGDFSHQMDQPFKSFLSGLLDITIVKPIIDACTGYDCITGEDLSDTERGMKIIFAVIDAVTLGSAIAATKGIELGGRGALMLAGKTVAGQAGSNTIAYTTNYIGEQLNLPPAIRILLSLGSGAASSKFAGKYILKASGTLKGYPSVNVNKGKVLGKIDFEDYFKIKFESVINQDSKTMTLGKFFKGDDGRPRTDSYVAIADKYHDTYFSLGEKWNQIEKKYQLADDDMFEIFDKPAVDDAVNSGKTIRFTQDPRKYRNCALQKEWIYLQQKYKFKTLKKEGEFWYAKR